MSSVSGESERPEKDSDLLLALINTEVERQSRLVGSLYQRASILIGASGISTALLTRDDLPLAWLVPIFLFVTSIVLAVLSLFFQKGKAPNPATLIDRWDRHDPERFRRNVLNGAAESHKIVDKSVRHRARLLSAGMILFASGWIFSFTILFISALNSL